MIVQNPYQRLDEHAREWVVAIDDIVETPGSLLGFGSQNTRPVVLKVVKQPGDEWRAGEVLAAFDGHGLVQVFQHSRGALLLERLRPARPLVDTVTTGTDDEATHVVADLLERMAGCQPPAECPTIRDWGRAFQRHAGTGRTDIPVDLFTSASRLYSRLERSQKRTQLLHGDLHHYNVLFDSDRGWLGIDPKGVVGEREYEIGAFLRNPIGYPSLFLAPAVLERRLNYLTHRLNLDLDRALAWGFGQAVLSVIWSIEDGETVALTHPVLKLAAILQSMLGSEA